MASAGPTWGQPPGEETPEDPRTAFACPSCGEGGYSEGCEIRERLVRSFAPRVMVGSSGKVGFSQVTALLAGGLGLPVTQGERLWDQVGHSSHSRAVRCGKEPEDAGPQPRASHLLQLRLVGAKHHESLSGSFFPVPLPPSALITLFPPVFVAVPLQT